MWCSGIKAAVVNTRISFKRLMHAMRSPKRNYSFHGGSCPVVGRLLTNHQIAFIHATHDVYKIMRGSRVDRIEKWFTLPRLARCIVYKTLRDSSKPTKETGVSSWQLIRCREAPCRLCIELPWQLQFITTFH